MLKGDRVELNDRAKKQLEKLSFQIHAKGTVLKLTTKGNVIVQFDGRDKKTVIPGRFLRKEKQMVRDPNRCQAGRDGECNWKDCPQERDGEPGKTGRHCPIDWDRYEDEI